MHSFSQTKQHNTSIWCAVTALYIVFAGYETQDALVVLFGLVSYVWCVFPERFLKAIEILSLFSLATREVTSRGHFPLGFIYMIIEGYYDSDRSTWAIGAANLCMGVYFHLYIFA